MDPPGFALESFDVMGGWRDRYRAVAENVKPEPGYRHERPGVRLSLRAAGGLPPASCPTAARSATSASSSACSCSDEVPVARNLARQLVIYATGAPVRFADRAELEQILQRASARPVRRAHASSHEIVQSELFQTK